MSTSGIFSTGAFDLTFSPDVVRRTSPQKLKEDACESYGANVLIEGASTISPNLLPVPLAGRVPCFLVVAMITLYVMRLSVSCWMQWYLFVEGRRFVYDDQFPPSETAEPVTSLVAKKTGSVMESHHEKEPFVIPLKLKRIDHCQMSRMTQLNEEKRQFTLLMRRRLAQATRGLSALDRLKDSRQSFLTRDFSDLSYVKSGTQSFGALSSPSVSTYTTELRTSSATSRSTLYSTNHTKETQRVFITMWPPDRYHHRQIPILKTKSEVCLSAQRAENIGKTISRTSYRIKQGTKAPSK